MRSDFTIPARRILAAGFILFAQSLALVPLPVLAQSVRVAGQQVFQVNTGTADLSSNKRVEAIQSNLDNAIVASKDKNSPTVGIIYVNGLPVITLAGYQICTVDGADAKDANTTPALLAQRWTDSLRKSMADKKSIASYIAQLSGSFNDNGGSNNSSNGSSSVGNGNSNFNSNNNNSNGGSAGGGSNTSSNGGGGSGAYNGSNTNTSYNNNNGNGNSGVLAADQYATSPSIPSPAPQLQAQQPAYAQPQNAVASSSSNLPSTAAYGYTSYSVPPQANFSNPPINYLPPQQAYIPPPNYNQAPYYAGGLKGSVATAPAGTVISAMLKISISTDVAQNGDLVEASILDGIPIQNGSIPAGTTLLGTITEARQSGRLSKSGHLGMKFTSMRTPDGITTPIQAHLTGLVGRYKLNGKGDETYLHGEGGKAKLGQTLIRGGVGAGAGAALGTAVGAIAGGPFGAGAGAWSGAAIGGGMGVGDMALRKGREVKLESGTRMQIQLDQPATITGSSQAYAQGGNI